MPSADTEPSERASFQAKGYPRDASGAGITSGALVRAAPAMAILAAVVYSCNGELMQALQKPGAASVSPLLNLVVCHVGGLVFAPLVAMSPPVSVVTMSRGTVPLASLLFSVAIMAYNYAWMKSAQTIPTGLTNTVFQSSISLVYLMSVCLFGEPVTLLRVGGVLLALVGAGMASGVNAHDLAAGGGLAAGVGLAGLAAIGFAVYQVLFRVYFGHLKSDPLFLAYFGLWVAVCHIVAILPMVFVASATGFEELTFPAGWAAVSKTGATGLFATVVNALNLCVVMWGSPMLLPISSALSIPVTLMLDMALHGIHPPPVEITGCAMLVLAFVLLAAQEMPGKPSKDAAWEDAL